MNFTFETTESTYAYCREVFECLQCYFDWTEQESLQLINNFWRASPILDDEDIRLHELPYYWSVCIHLKASNQMCPNWWHDPSLWPPPAEYFERFGRI
jgi:hypothetical protein